ncbi:MAG: DUF374 domain-containing protein [Candidatus Eisenbacteria bacterium]|nr:DUF374 domain-containing protein [Candidatus Eisenbacteria bacterium]
MSARRATFWRRPARCAGSRHELARSRISGRGSVRIVLREAGIASMSLRGPKHWDPETLGLWGSRLLMVWGKTWRLRIVGREREAALRKIGTPPLYALWHAKILTLAYAYRNQGVGMLISRNRDGEIISQIVTRMGYRPVRGSTSRGGMRAILEMVREGRAGRILGITPDGPRGPAETLQAGVLLAAQRSGLPVVAMGLAAHPSTRLASWDGFLIPHPGARCVVSVAPPLRIPQEIPPAELEARCGPGLEEHLKANDDHAHAELARWTAGAGEPRPFLSGPPPGWRPVRTPLDEANHGVGV